MENVIEKKSYQFAMDVVKLTRVLEKRGCEYALTRQLIRSGTSIGANISEAQQAESKRDFASKMSIALKEAMESRYWLRLLKGLESITEDEAAGMLESADELIRILTKIVRTTRGE